MANNLAIGPNVVVATQDVDFADVTPAITSLNISIIYRVDNPVKSYVPGRAINAITGFETAKGYYVLALADMDLEAYLIPPIPEAPPPWDGSVNRTLQRLNDNEGGEFFDKYLGWPMSYSNGDERAIVVRSGERHTYNGGDVSEMVRYRTSDGGFTWVRDIIHSESGIDVRNYAGGTTSAGTILIFYARFTTSETFLSQHCMRSTDGGESFVHSGALDLNGNVDQFSPHGLVVELPNGDLLQTFYGNDNVYTLKSTDDGLTWGSPVTIITNTYLFEYNEACICWLSGNNLACVIRKEVGDTTKPAFVFNSDDLGATWVNLGQATWPGSSYIFCISPLIFRKSDTSFTLISTWRGSYQGFGECEIEFGDVAVVGFMRLFYPGNMPLMHANNIDFGYPCLLDWSTEDDQDILVSFCDGSVRWDGTAGNHATDLVVCQAFRRELTITKKISGTYASGPQTYSPEYHMTDELTAYDNGNAYQHVIREAGDYEVHVEATFSGNTTGTFRKLTVQKWSSVTDVFVSDLHEVSQLNTENTFDFTFETTRSPLDALVLEIDHDATGTLTVDEIIFTITKL